MGDVLKHSSHGAIGALVIEPQGTEWKTDCEILSNPPADCLDAAATVTFKNGSQKPFREFVAIIQNDVSAFYQNSPLPNLRNADDAEDSGQKAINYRSEPLWARLQADPEADPGTMADFDYHNAYTSIAVCNDGSKDLRPDGNCQNGTVPAQGHGDPETPLFTAMAGDQVRFRVVEPMGHPRNHAFSVFGHDWPIAPATSTNCGGTSIASCRLEDKVRLTSLGKRYLGSRVGTITGIGPQRHIDAVIESAGGVFKIAGDYMYRTHEGFTSGGGMWGLMRVVDPKDCKLQSGHWLNKKTTSPRDLVCR
jgi:manganese oxidase